MKGVIYARYSSDNQREESIKGQIRENAAYAQKNGITIVGHYIDRAFSAKTDDRPEFQRIIERNRERLVDALVKCIVLYDDKLIITVTFRDEPIVIMTSEEVADVARLGSDIVSLAPPKKKAQPSAMSF